jgi:UDP-2,3-diacylglucosamine hydrolase
MAQAPAVIQLGPDERVWVTGDVHLAPDDTERAEFFLRFFAEARRSADRLVLLGDLFDYWIGPRHGRACGYRPVIEALEEAATAGFPIDFIPGNRDFLGPGELRALGVTVHGDAVVYDRGGERTIVTHGDLLVAGDLSYKRYRRCVRSWWFHLGYWLVPAWFRLFVARILRGASERKLSRVEPYAFPIDLERSQEWLARHEARELLMGHLHREETHEHGETVTRMLPGWHAGSGPHFVLGPTAELRAFTLPAEPTEPRDQQS